MKRENKGDSQRIQSIAFGVVLLILFILVCRLLAPFFIIIFWSILFYIILNPLFRRCTARYNSTTIKGKIFRNILAAVFAVGAITIIIIPLSFLLYQLIVQMTELGRQVRDYLVSQPFSASNALENITKVIRDISFEQIVITGDELRSTILDYISMGIQRLVLLSSDIARNIGSFLASLLFMVFSLFFLFVDGSYLTKLALRIIPIRKEYIKALVGKFKEITMQLVLGYLIIALTEAVMAFLIFTIFSIQGTLVFSAIIFFLAFIPIIGPTIVWIPLGIIQILNGNLWKGILLMIVSCAVLSSIDNFLRPVILKDRIQLHPLIIFFAILGGINAFGFNGIILGPMIMIIFLTVFDLFLTEHKLEQN
jgi:predicted PurR-regulated permease PerM